MGTRSLTHVVRRTPDGERDATLCTIYRQFDGYPSGQGLDLATFLAPKRVVNGYSFDNLDKQINGAEDAAVQIAAFMKLSTSRSGQVEVGNVYLHPPGTNDLGEEYTYTVEVKEASWDGEGTITMSVETIHDEDGFSGSPQEFLDWLKERG